jgi:DNA-binding LacI/PurR family transcriptional regulator
VLSRNDDEGKMLMNILYKANLAIPDRISLLSFDNGPQSDVMSMSSVDFGFSGLGYAAFHAILGDLPVAGQRRALPARPSVVDRGTVGIVQDMAVV